jgi:hypothetical protein
VDRHIRNAYTARAIRKLSRKEKPDVLLVMVAWGERYIKGFLNIGLPMLLNPGNLPAMADGKRLLVRIFTDGPSRSSLLAAPLMQRLQQYAEVSYEVVPQKLLRRPVVRTWDDKAVLYGHFGGLTHMGIHEAIALGSDLVFIWPDQILGPGSYGYLRRLMDDPTRDCMAVRAINVNHKGFVTELDRYRDKEGILIPTIKQLVGIVSRHIRDESRRFFLSGMEMKILTGFNYLIIARPDGLAVRQANPDPVYMSKRVLKPDLDFDFNPPDGRLLSLLFPNPESWSRIDIPRTSEDYFCCDVSDENSPGLDEMPAGPLTKCLNDNLKGGWTDLQRTLFQTKTIMKSDSAPAWENSGKLLALEKTLDQLLEDGKVA